MPPAACTMLLVILLISYWLLVTFLVVWFRLTGVAAAVLVSDELAAAPGGPPPLPLVEVSVFSSLMVLMRTTWPSGSNFSSVRVMVSQFKSVETRTTAWPAPRTCSSMPCAFLVRYCSKLRRAVSWLLDKPATESGSSFSDRTLPRLSTTETLLTCNPSTLLATRKRMELTPAEGSWALPRTRTKTEAVGLRALSINRRFSGMTIMTRADSI